MTCFMLYYDDSRASILRLAGKLVTLGYSIGLQVSVAAAAEGVLIRIGVVAGDGVGPEVTAEALAVLSLAGSLEGLEYGLVPFDLGGERFLADGAVLPEDEIAGLAGCDAILLGAVGHPGVPPGILEKGILLRLRFDFQQYINLRPIQLFPGVEGPIRGKGPDDIDMVVVRENNEDLYVGAGGFTRKGTPRRWRSRPRSTPAQGSSAPCGTRSTWLASASRSGTFRGLSALDRGIGPGAAGDPGRQDQRPDLRPRPVDARVQPEVGREYPEIKSDYQHVDACCMRMVASPERFDVIVTTNMFGDIITDLGAVLQGGMGLAASGNLNPERTLSEHVRAGARLGPRHRGQRDGQPAGGDPVGGDDAGSLEAAAGAERVREAVRAVLVRSAVRTPDLGGLPAQPTSAAWFAMPCWPEGGGSKGLAVDTKVPYNRIIGVVDCSRLDPPPLSWSSGTVHGRNASKPMTRMIRIV